MHLCFSFSQLSPMTSYLCFTRIWEHSVGDGMLSSTGSALWRRGKSVIRALFFFLYNFYIITAEHIIQYVSVLVIYSTEYKLFLWDRTSWLRYVMFQTATWSKLESLLIKKCAFFRLISCFSCLTGNSYKNHLVSWDFFCYITETVVDFGLVG